MAVAVSWISWAGARGHGAEMLDLLDATFAVLGCRVS